MSKQFHTKNELFLSYQTGYSMMLDEIDRRVKESNSVYILYPIKYEGVILKKVYFDNEIENTVIVKYNTEDYFLLSDLDPKALEKVIYSIKEVKPIKENK